MTGWYKRGLRQSLKREQQKFVDAMRHTPKPKVVWLVPKGSPCWNCMMPLGSGICKNTCSYYKELLKLRDAGKLKKRGE